MFLYLRLVLAHFIADYPLQTNWIYFHKIRGFPGQLLHASIHTATYTVFLFSYWGNPWMWLFVAFVGCAHLTFDILKVKLIDRTRLSPLFTYTLDQVLHLTSLAAIFLFPFGASVPPQPASPLLAWYWNDHVIVFLIAFFFATYFTTYFLECWRAKIQRDEHIDGFVPHTSLRKYYGICERGAIMTLVALPHWAFAAPFVLLLRLPLLLLLKRLGRESGWLLNLRDLFVGTVFSAAAGITVSSFFQN